MSRWKVYKDSENGEWQWATWVATPVSQNWWEEPRIRRFPQWGMALHYVAREAQKSPNTITIKDPTGAVCDLTATVTSRHHIYLKACDDSFTLAPHEWRPLAGFLLTAADRAEEA